MGRLGFEPRTDRLRADCSTAELATRWIQPRGRGCAVVVAPESCPETDPSEGITQPDPLPASPPG